MTLALRRTRFECVGLELRRGVCRSANASFRAALAAARIVAEKASLHSSAIQPRGSEVLICRRTASCKSAADWLGGVRRIAGLAFVARANFCWRPCLVCLLAAVCPSCVGGRIGQSFAAVNGTFDELQKSFLMRASERAARGRARL